MDTWLRHYATSQDMGSIPNEVTWFFSSPNFPAALWAMGSTHPLTEMSTKNLPGVKGSPPARNSDNLTAICDRLSRKWMWEPRCLKTLCLHGLLTGIALPPHKKKIEFLNNFIKMYYHFQAPTNVFPTNSMQQHPVEEECCSSSEGSLFQISLLYSEWMWRTV
jgi:hypothetical protein